MTFTPEDKAKVFKLLLRKSLQDTDKYTYAIETFLDKAERGCDCLATQLDRVSGDVAKRLFFDGVYMDAYSSVFIEKENVNRLKSLIVDVDTDHIYFVNFTPRNTYIFDLFKLDAEGKLLFINGDNAYLDITDAKEIDFPYTPETVITNGSPDLKDIVDDKNTGDPNFKKYKVDADGNLFFETREEFSAAPLHVKKRHLIERYIKINLLPTENKEKMLEKYGTVEKLHKFIKERVRLNFLKNSGKDCGPNKYEIL